MSGAEADELREAEFQIGFFLGFLGWEGGLGGGSGGGAVFLAVAGVRGQGVLFGPDGGAEEEGFGEHGGGARDLFDHCFCLGDV